MNFSPFALTCQKPHTEQTLAPLPLPQPSHSPPTALPQPSHTPPTPLHTPLTLFLHPFTPLPHPSHTPLTPLSHTSHTPPTPLPLGEIIATKRRAKPTQRHAKHGSTLKEKLAFLSGLMDFHEPNVSEQIQFFLKVPENIFENDQREFHQYRMKKSYFISRRCV